MGKVYLVGAGPGDVELITLKGKRLIQEADIVLYDRLINHQILDWATNAQELIYVGKKDQHHSLPQEQINQLLVDYGQKYNCVVRLKGGDPFVFGRGGEEAEYLRERGLEFEIVPGISSSVSAPAYAGIPVTHRKVASSFAVITGHSSHINEQKEEEFIYPNTDTLVFLMGVKNRHKIAKQLLSQGRSPQLPVAFVQHGTTSRQKVWTTTLGELGKAEESEKIPVHSPAVMVIGLVVNLREKLHWFNPAEAIPAAIADDD